MLQMLRYRCNGTQILAAKYYSPLKGPGLFGEMADYRPREGTGELGTFCAGKTKRP